ncbi:MAG: hypothetical protein K6G33_06035 [Ruminococcus sp.]|uniref:hypothetical protein n=1 Tax=Ruminococcus sp. TaxID=41978 RepID=UPI0025CCFA7D|nr:hypothetical protein [Ruminococcus sp.]MCR5600282.1 hypothetical protein [Ruminococcus sp.]
MDEKFKGQTGAQITRKIVIELLIGIGLMALLALIVFGFLDYIHEGIVGIGKMG